MERPTGHVMRSGRDRCRATTSSRSRPGCSACSASQLAIGNTSFNKLLSVCRNPLDVLKSSGQRIFVRTERGWELLGLPSAFEMGPNERALGLPRRASGPSRSVPRPRSTRPSAG